MSDVNDFYARPLETRHLPASYDAWQAASLLVGLYGPNAARYADDRRAQVQQTGDWVATKTWDLIVSEIERLLRTAPAGPLN